MNSSPTRTPDFLVIGAQKAGTTSLYRYLSRRSDIFMPEVKELRYFSLESSREGAAVGGEHIPDLDAYLRYFDACRPEQICGEVSPSYIFYPGTARRIREVCPDVRLVAVLRNPVDRAVSEYWHHWKMGRRLPLSMASFFHDEPVAEVPVVDTYADCVRRGYYARQLREFLDIFPRDQLLVLFNEDLESEPQKCMDRISGFLGLPREAVDAGFERHNEGGQPSPLWLGQFLMIAERILDLVPLEEVRRMAIRRRWRRRLRRGNARIDRKLREWLHGQFANDTAELEALLDVRLDHWRSSR